MDASKYDQRGVSASKGDVHRAIAHLDKGIFPNAFCKVLPDIVGNDPDFCNIMHADTAGTKTSLAYLYWRETGDLSVWKGIVQDALVMNLDDMACIGCVSDIVISSTIGRNKRLIPAEVLETIIGACSGFIDAMEAYGISLRLAGGETADVGDIVRTLDVGYTTFARMRRSDVVVNDIRPGDVVVGFASYGQASYETTYNGGMGSNGLTSARHDVLSKEYASGYPESYDPSLPEELVYAGSRRLTEEIMIEGWGKTTVGKLILSPTRTYLPLVKAILDTVPKAGIHGLIHCSGGGQTKVGKFIDGVRVVKDNLLPVPPLFELIRQESGTSWQEMYQVFNMGHRLECYVPEELADTLVNLATGLGIDAAVIGHVESSEQPGIEIRSPYGIFHYTAG